MSLNPLPPISPDSVSTDAEPEFISTLLVALLVIGIWAVSLTVLCCIDLSHLPVLGRIPIVLWQMFLYTGLFITAHDAMHGIVFARNRQVNDWIGAIALGLYALIPYSELSRKHRLHHDYPAGDQDPDFHNGRHKNFFAWYFHFMKSYWSWLRLGSLILLFNVIHATLHIPELNLTLAWVYPSVLSSLQLFYFGTYLPHREPPGGYSEPHRAYSSPRSTFWSFVTCYHFGYHEEHHQYPHLSWWKLPQAYQRRSITP